MRFIHQLENLVIVGIAYLVALVSTFALMSPEGALFAGVGTKMAAAALMLFFGPYLLPIGFTTGFFPGLGPLCGVVAVLPFLAAHIVFLVILSKRIPLWRRLGRFGKSAQKTALVLWALLSAAGVWYEVPVITHYDLVDLVFSGHLHGGQWRLPGLGLGVYGPSAGGPHVGERHLFPRRTGGVYPLNANTAMVVSRGLARESTPIPRFFNHPELVIVGLREK